MKINARTIFNGLLKYRLSILLILFSLASASIYFIKQNLKVESSLKIWFLDNDSTYQNYIKYQQEQGSDEIIIAMIPAHETEVFSKQFIQKIERFHKKIDTLKYVENCYSIYNATFPYISFSGLKFKKIYNSKNKEFTKKNSNKFPFIKNRIVSKNEKYALLYIQLKPTIQIEKLRGIILETIEKEIAKEFDSYYLSGIPVLNKGSNISIKKESSFFSVVSIMLILFLLLFLLPNPWYVPIALIAILLPIVYLYGLFVIFNIKLNTIVMILPTILLVYSLADVIHIFNNYNFQKNNNPSTETNKNIILGLQQSLVPCFLTTLTTMLGYLALTFSSLFPLRITGIFAFFGLFIAFITAYLITIIGLSYIEAFKLLQPNKSIIKNRWKKIIQFTNSISDQYPKQIISISLILAITSLFLVPQIVISSHLLRFMGEGKEKKDYLAIEKQFDGILRFDINIMSTDTSSVLEPQKLKLINNFEKKLIDEKLFHSFISINQFKNGIEKQAITMFLLKPKLRKKFKDDLKKLNKKQKEFLYLLNNDFTKTNLIAYTKLNSTLSIKNKFKLIDSIFHQTIPKKYKLAYQIQGYSPLYVKLNEYIFSSQVWSFGGAFIFTFIIISFWIRKVKLSLLIIYPNILPIMLMVIVLVLFHIDLEVGTIMIAPIMLGIAMDDTIHIIHKYKIYKKKGVNVKESINNALLFTGKAVFLTSFVLIIGFSILSFGKIPSIRIFGILSAITVGFVFIFDIIVLPALIKLFDN